jgi:hypothetical protein
MRSSDGELVDRDGDRPSRPVRTIVFAPHRRRVAGASTPTLLTQVVVAVGVARALQFATEVSWEPVAHAGEPAERSSGEIVPVRSTESAAASSASLPS